MKFTVIDFETANGRRNSACALGIVMVDDKRIVEKSVHLIKPHDMQFASMNISIHGIYPEDVVNEPTFDVLYQNIFKCRLENQLVIAHNASFDMSVLRACLDLYNLPYPQLNYICTVKVAQKQWPFLRRHSLDVVSEYLGFEFKHHDAFDDARACANILLKAMAEQNVDSPLELLDRLDIKMGKLYVGGYKACSTSRKK